MLKLLAAMPGVFCLILVDFVIAPLGAPLGRLLSLEDSFSQPFACTAMAVFYDAARAALKFFLFVKILGW